MALIRKRASTWLLSGGLCSIVLAAPAGAGPASAWQPMGEDPRGAIGLIRAEDPVPTVHGNGRYVAMLDEDGRLVVYRQFRAGYGTAQAWLREGTMLNRAGHIAMHPSLLSGPHGSLYAAWIEARDRLYIRVARMRLDEHDRVRWEPVGDPIATGRLYTVPTRPRLVELSGSLRLVLEDEEGRARVARLTTAGWQVARTPIALTGTFGNVIVYDGALYVVQRVGSAISGGIDSVSRISPTPDGDVRVQSLGEITPIMSGRIPRLAAGPRSLNDGRPIVANAEGDAVTIRQLTAAGHAFAPLMRIPAPVGVQFVGSPVIAALSDEILVGAADAQRALRIHRIAAVPSLRLIGTVDPPPEPHQTPRLVVSADAGVAMLTYQRADERAAAFALRPSPVE